LLLVPFSPISFLLFCFFGFFVGSRFMNKKRQKRNAVKEYKKSFLRQDRKGKKAPAFGSFSRYVSWVFPVTYLFFSDALRLFAFEVQRWLGGHNWRQGD